MNLDSGSEDGDGPDPLLNSIMDAVSSMKEATADKIYQKIHKQGNTNYSKPQVDRALANALKYGIFEVRNNRYKMKEEALDDEDTVYCRKAKNREQTPYRSEEYNRGDINPEKDNRRFKAPGNGEEKKCIACGKLRKPKEICDRPIDASPGTSNLKTFKSGNDNKINKKKIRKDETRKRKSRSNSECNEECKKRKPSDCAKCIAKKNKRKTKKSLNLKRDISPDPIAKFFPRGGFKDSESSLLTRYRLDAIECCELVDDDQPTTSTIKIYTIDDGKLSETEFSDTSAVSEESRKNERIKDEKKEDKNIKAELSLTKKSESNDLKNPPMDKGVNTSSRGKDKIQEVNKFREKSVEVKTEWHPEELHEGTVVRQTNNNAITVEPMDGLPLKNPEGTSYFT